MEHYKSDKRSVHCSCIVHVAIATFAVGVVHSAIIGLSQMTID